MKNENKVTKRMVLEAIKAVAEKGDVDFGTVTAEDVYAYADTTLVQLDTKIVKAAENRAKKRAEGDELKDKILGILTDELQVLNEIAEKLGDEELTNAKIAYKINTLCKEGLAHKANVDMGEGRKLMGYAAGPAPVEE